MPSKLTGSNDTQKQCPNCYGTKFNSKGYQSNGNKRWKCRTVGCGFSFTAADKARRGHLEAEIISGINTSLPASKVYFVTYAQNNTSVHGRFLDNLEAYAKFRRGKILVVPGLYRNPSLFSATEEGTWWDISVSKYLFAGREELGSSLAVLGDLRIQPTAVTPLTGHESVSGHRSAIIAHPKLALKTVAEPQSRLPKIITTTGAITIQNYSHTRAGKIGEFHHTIGACLVEIAGEECHVRQINAKDDGSFVDLEWQVKDGKISKAKPALALHLGDWHAWFTDPAVIDATFGRRGIVDVLKPSRIIYNDTFDGFSISHHHQKDPFLQAIKTDAGLNLVANEMRDTVESIFKYTPPGVEAVLVASNHDEHLMRWLKEIDWRRDPQNSEFYLETALYVRRNSKMVDGVPHMPDPFHYWFSKDPRAAGNRGSKFVLLSRGDDYEVAGVSLSNHGDQGANGSRATLKQYARMGSKTISGHTHTFGIEEGAYSSGTSSRLKRGFNTGLSTWMHGHTVLYANGKRSLIMVIGGKWRSKP